MFWILNLLYKINAIKPDVLINFNISPLEDVLILLWVSGV